MYFELHTSMYRSGWFSCSTLKNQENLWFSFATTTTLFLFLSKQENNNNNQFSVLNDSSCVRNYPVVFIAI